MTTLEVTARVRITVDVIAGRWNGNVTADDIFRVAEEQAVTHLKRLLDSRVVIVGNPSVTTVFGKLEE